MNWNKIQCGGLALALLASALAAGCGNGSTVSKAEEQQFRNPPATPPAEALKFAASQGQQKPPASPTPAAAPK